MARPIPLIHIKVSRTNDIPSTPLKRIQGRTIVSASIKPHIYEEELLNDGRRLVMTSAYAFSHVATKTFYFSLVATVFVFVSMLLTGLHP
jgi:hypothetical protein